MNLPRLTRRHSLLLLPLLFAACGDNEPASYAPLNYTFLPPIPLNVLHRQVEQQFVPSHSSPDVTDRAPVTPMMALRTMAEDRLRPFGNDGRAVLAIQDASLTRHGDELRGSMRVMLTIYRGDNTRAGYVEAHVQRRESGGEGSIRFRLYQLVRVMMDQMNVELEFQIKRNLKEWIVEAAAPAAPVEQAPLPAPTRR